MFRNLLKFSFANGKVTLRGIQEAYTAVRLMLVSQTFLDEILTTVHDNIFILLGI